MHCYTCVVKPQLAFWGHQSCDQPYWLAQSHLPTLLPTAWGHTPLLGIETNSTTNSMGTHTTLLHYEQHGDTHHFWEVTSFRYMSLALWFSHVSPSTHMNLWGLPHHRNCKPCSQVTRAAASKKMVETISSGGSKPFSPPFLCRN